MGLSNLAVLGTDKFEITGPVYPDVLKKFGLSYRIPEEKDREHIDMIIFSELVNGKFTDNRVNISSRKFEKLKRQGCDAAVLGCT